jgi:hydroxylysine kinase
MPTNRGRSHMTPDGCSSQSLISSADVDVPTLSAEVAARVALGQFGVQGELAEMLSERDQIFLIRVASADKYIMRLSGARESSDAIEAQTALLLELTSRCPEIAVPRPCKGRSGTFIEVVEEVGQKYRARLFSYVDGRPIANRSISKGLLTDIGRSLALIDKALSGLRMRGLNKELIFNIERMERLKPLTSFIENRDERQLVQAVLDRMEREVFQKLGRLRHQVIHNDLNGANILTLTAAPDKVAGIIDFGDVIEGALIIDLAVAIARQVGLVETVASAAAMVKGYNNVLPLKDDEIEILFDIICARLAMRGLIWSWRKFQNHPRYHAGRIGDSLKMLACWTHLGKDTVTESFVRMLGANV